jgi:transcription initiation factor IIE alpha subunit
MTPDKKDKKKPSVSKTARIAKIVNKPKDAINEKILKIVFERKEISVPDLAIEVGLHTSNIGRRASILQNEGLIIKSKGDKTNKSYVKWVGGVPGIESDLLESTNKHVSASLLAECYDSMITSAFSIFALLFEDNYWEILVNLKEGLTDTELQKNLGTVINLDSVRRILVTCDAHNLVKIKTIRDSAGKDVIKLFEPLYRIESVNRDYIEYMVLIRGLASAMQYKMSTKKTPGYSHFYESMLDDDIHSFINIKEHILTKTTGSESELLNKLLFNYDFAPDLDRYYGNEKWRDTIKNSNYLKLENNDHIIISDGFNK